MMAAHPAGQKRKATSMCGWENQQTGDDGQALVTSALTRAKFLVGNRTRAMLENGLPKKYVLGYPCRLFSPNIAGELVAYLKRFEEEADPLILALVRDVYGDDWVKPFVTMFDA